MSCINTTLRTWREQRNRPSALFRSRLFFSSIATASRSTFAQTLLLRRFHSSFSFVRLLICRCCRLLSNRPLSRSIATGQHCCDKEPNAHSPHTSSAVRTHCAKTPGKPLFLWQTQAAGLGGRGVGEVVGWTARSPSARHCIHVAAGVLFMGSKQKLFGRTISELTNPRRTLSRTLPDPHPPVTRRVQRSHASESSVSVLDRRV